MAIRHGKANSNKNRKTKPSKPYPSFPLTPHNNGQWCKKIRGKVHFFGVWHKPEAALTRYHRMAADLHDGRRPMSNTVSPDGATVKYVANCYLTAQRNRVATGEITPQWFQDCLRTAKDLVSFVDPQRLVEDLRPDGPTGRSC